MVASLPRSGTKYISVVLTKLGLCCGHEVHFNCRSHRTSVDEGPPIWGDASWMSMPFIEELPSNTVVLHQTRDPLKVLNSNLPPGGDSYFRTWDYHAGLISDPLYNKPIPWKRFIWDHTQDWVWPDELAEGPESKQEIDRLLFWWMNWNSAIEYHTLKRSDLVYIRYRVEDLDSSVLLNIVKILDPESGVTEGQCADVLKEVSTTTNRHREPNNRITFDMLSPANKMLMLRYGYDPLQVS